MSVQVQFLEARLAVISVPLEHYSHVFHGIARLALGTWKAIRTGDSEHTRDRDNFRHDYCDFEEDLSDYFHNISITPTECSIICREDLIQPVFGDEYLSSLKNVAVLPRRYMAIKVDAAGVSSGNERILTLSSSLSAAGIPIFFMSTYFSDYLLVPTDVKEKVRDLLEKNNFVFSSLENSYIALQNRSDSSSTSSLILNDDEDARLEGPTADNKPLETYHLKPAFDQTELLITGPRSQSDLDLIEFAVLRILARRPCYFSITTYADEIALVLEKEDASLFPPDSLMGSQDELYIPVTLDLRQVPVDVVGVVAEVAAKLEGCKIPMSFLSTAMTSTVFITRENAEHAKRVCGTDFQY
ncbi:hypothetical protein B9G98_01083 [Wickerhamiella sorbophila]|uniref:CASTOR ACT domain-containing protein n=1 Tax=Wickerhamiella sorbophila TaxID=45607 RepID=A0A2T0FEN7_9ASCO|nr:hypothetical protein B9G98_01083 [Wickerhamiella sorbophila]PRT53463.1 hypothetical protein B9G98_01083 [Wickerhamiella sorbophila]